MFGCRKPRNILNSCFENITIGEKERCPKVNGVSNGKPDDHAVAGAENKHILGRKREGYLEWADYFMAVAFLSAQRSKDPRTQVGACIVNPEKKIVGIGYNGMPNGCSDDVMPWGKEAESILNTKKLYVCHAELNAVLNKNSSDVKDCTIYVALFPCNECAKIVIQSGIKEVVYYSDKYADLPAFQASKKMLDMAGVKYRQYIPQKKKIIIDFSVLDNTVTLADNLSKIHLNSDAQS